MKVDLKDFRTYVLSNVRVVLNEHDKNTWFYMLATMPDGKVFIFIPAKGFYLTPLVMIGVVVNFILTGYGYQFDLVSIDTSEERDIKQSFVHRKHAEKVIRRASRQKDYKKLRNYPIHVCQYNGEIV